MIELRTLMIVGLTIGISLVMFSTFTGSMFSGYNNTTDLGYISTSQETMDDVNEMQETLQSSRTTTLGTAWYYISAPFRVALMMFRSVNILSSLGSDLGRVLHVPASFVAFVIGIITIIIMYGIIKILKGSSTGVY